MYRSICTRAYKLSTRTCVCVYIYILCIYMLQICIYLSIHIFMYICIYCENAYVHVCVGCICMYVCVHTCISMYTCIYCTVHKTSWAMCLPPHAKYPHIHTHTYLPTHTYLATYTYLPACLPTCLPTYIRTYVHVSAVIGKAQQLKRLFPIRSLKAATCIKIVLAISLDALQKRTPSLPNGPMND